ncbi:hypothetical protein KP79_PYT25630 [Mizuhopecten yessoensis]|uniref:Short-chain collagen C4 n=1 Tax=Mizuhopecten yessoensis TaxID=6573 RepID=A0A210QQU3_MIZYE|nr:hypothetical protein KP79_PYT25630 [Mizuhopecten yessoensis]
MLLNRISLVVFVFYALIVCGHCKDDSNKRILLNDPNYIQQLITHLQGELQTLQATVQTQHGEHQTLQTTVQTQHGELQTLQNTVQTQHGEISSLKTQLSQANKGYAGGSWYGHTGAAVDYLCLPRDPEWLQTTVVPDDYTGRLYGAEYESNTGHTLFGPQSRDEEVPCAVCRSTSFVSSVMIPARTTCYSGWTKAFSGSLAAGYYGHIAASQYVCVDENAHPLAGGADRNDNGILFLGVKAFCGSLRCPPYEQDKFISCVVCMK